MSALPTPRLLYLLHTNLPVLRTPWPRVGQSPPGGQQSCSESQETGGMIRIVVLPAPGPWLCQSQLDAHWSYRHSSQGRGGPRRESSLPCTLQEETPNWRAMWLTRDPRVSERQAGRESTAPIFQPTAPATTPPCPPGSPATLVVTQQRQRGAWVRLGPCKLQQSRHLLSYIPSTSLPVFPPLPHLFPSFCLSPTKKEGQSSCGLVGSCVSWGKQCLQLN